MSLQSCLNVWKVPNNWRKENLSSPIFRKDQKDTSGNHRTVNLPEAGESPLEALFWAHEGEEGVTVDSQHRLSRGKSCMTSWVSSVIKWLELRMRGEWWMSFTSTLAMLTTLFPQYSSIQAGILQPGWGDNQMGKYLVDNESHSALRLVTSRVHRSLYWDLSCLRSVSLMTWIRWLCAVSSS